MKLLLNALLWILSKLAGRGGCGGACAPVLVACLALFCGCVSQERVVDGTQTRIGLLVPVSESQIYGFNLLSYTSGTAVDTLTNQPVRVEREYCSSNSYFGVIGTTESSKTVIEVKK